MGACCGGGACRDNRRRNNVYTHQARSNGIVGNYVGQICIQLFMNMCIYMYTYT
jgi:hypothetical protein